MKFKTPTARNMKFVFGLFIFLVTIGLQAQARKTVVIDAGHVEPIMVPLGLTG